MKTKLTLITLLLAVSLLGCSAPKKVDDKTYNKVVDSQEFKQAEVIPTPAETTTTSTPSKEKVTVLIGGKKVKLDNPWVIIEHMHKMANARIIAVDGEVWGEEPMDPEVINGLLLAAKAYEHDPSNTWAPDAIEILERWKTGDFSKCVEDHNYVWGLLDGTVGEAACLRGTGDVFSGKK
jgi:hypothetical protein